MSMESKKLLAVLPGIAVNFTDQKLCRLKSKKMSKLSMCYVLPFEGCKTDSHISMHDPIK